MSETSQNQSRTIYFDYLRVLATIGVVFNHVDIPTREICAKLGSCDRLVNVGIDSLVQWAVPVFLMISGAIFLSRDIPIKKIYAKYIFRLLAAWVVWSSIYEVFNNCSLLEKIWNITHGASQVHLWFIPLVIGLYIFIPIFKQIIKSEGTVRYFLAIACVSALILQFTSLIDEFGNSFFRAIKDHSGIDNFVNLDGLFLALGFSSYYILGYYLDKKELSRRLKSFIYILGIIGFIYSFFYFLKKHDYSGKGNYLLIGEKYFRVNFFFESVAVFVFFKYCNLKQNRFITALSKYSFGAYLVHFLVLRILSIHFGLNVSFCNPVFSYVIVGALATVLSFSISAFLHQIPIVKKYIV